MKPPLKKTFHVRVRRTLEETFIVKALDEQSAQESALAGSFWGLVDMNILSTEVLGVKEAK